VRSWTPQFPIPDDPNRGAPRTGNAEPVRNEIELSPLFTLSSNWLSTTMSILTRAFPSYISHTRWTTFITVPWTKRQHCKLPSRKRSIIRKADGTRQEASADESFHWREDEQSATNNPKNNVNQLTSNTNTSPDCKSRRTTRGAVTKVIRRNSSLTENQNWAL
jgi:hypothetical protein